MFFSIYRPKNVCLVFRESTKFGHLTYFQENTDFPKVDYSPKKVDFPKSSDAPKKVTYLLPFERKAWLSSYISWLLELSWADRQFPYFPIIFHSFPSPLSRASSMLPAMVGTPWPRRLWHEWELYFWLKLREIQIFDKLAIFGEFAIIGKSSIFGELTIFRWIYIVPKKSQISKTRL